MSFDLEMDMSGLTNPKRKYCYICFVEMQPIGMDKVGSMAFQCPKCKIVYHEEGTVY